MADKKTKEEVKEEVKELSFEEKLNKLEEIAKDLQDPNTDLQKAVFLYETGMKLANDVDKELSKIERRIEIVTSAPGESPEGVLTEKL